MRSPLSDGEWHRLHPLTPVLRGGLFLIVVTASSSRTCATASSRGSSRPRRLGALRGATRRLRRQNNLWLVAGLVVLGVLLLLLGIFWLSWRFHTFRITGDDVEVRSGVLFRTHRRARSTACRAST
jgi:putative membrane protein